MYAVTRAQWLSVCHVQTEWQWDQAGVFRGSLMIVRRDPGRVQYREAEGVDLVGVWGPPYRLNWLGLGEGIVPSPPLPLTEGPPARGKG